MMKIIYQQTSRYMMQIIVIIGILISVTYILHRIIFHNSFHNESSQINSNDSSSEFIMKPNTKNDFEQKHLPNCLDINEHNDYITYSSNESHNKSTYNSFRKYYDECVYEEFVENVHKTFDVDDFVRNPYKKHYIHKSCTFEEYVSGYTWLPHFDYLIHNKFDHNMTYERFIKLFARHNAYVFPFDNGDFITPELIPDNELRKTNCYILGSINGTLIMMLGQTFVCDECDVNILLHSLYVSRRNHNEPLMKLFDLINSAFDPEDKYKKKLRKLINKQAVTNNLTVADRIINVVREQYDPSICFKVEC